jgi:hypothetical protein
LQAKVKLWQENFVALDLAAGHQVPPAGLFGTLLDAIDADEEALSGRLTRRAGTGDIKRPMGQRRLAFVRILVKPDYRAGYRRYLTLHGYARL